VLGVFALALILIFVIFRKVYKKELVKRSIMLKIFAAWIITVPASGLLAAFIYYAIRGMTIS
jgi:PiT family inorganic phosphate transporter